MDDTRLVPLDVKLYLMMRGKRAPEDIHVVGMRIYGSRPMLSAILYSPVFANAVGCRHVHVLMVVSSSSRAMMKNNDGYCFVGVHNNNDL